MEESGERAVLADAGDAVMLLVSPALWTVLQMQAEHEGVSPGTILSKAVELHVGAHGSPEVKAAVEAMRKKARR